MRCASGYAAARPAANVRLRSRLNQPERRSRASAPILELTTPGLHQRDETGLVPSLDEPADRRGRIRQRGQRGAAVLVQGLNIEIQVRIVLRDQRGHLELRVERRARDLLQ